jgi:hypothetical protein
VAAERPDNSSTQSPKACPCTTRSLGSSQLKLAKSPLSLSRTTPTRDGRGRCCVVKRYSLLVTLTTPQKSRALRISLCIRALTLTLGDSFFSCHFSLCLFPIIDCRNYRPLPAFFEKSCGRYTHPSLNLLVIPSPHALITTLKELPTLELHINGIRCHAVSQS